MKITRTNAAEVLSQLSPFAVKIIRGMFVEGGHIHIDTGEIGQYHNAIIELIARNILRADYDIIGGKFVTVLQPGGKRIVEIIRKQVAA